MKIYHAEPFFYYILNFDANNFKSAIAIAVAASITTGTLNAIQASCLPSISNFSSSLLP